MGELFNNRSLDDFRDLLADLDTFIDLLPARFNRVLFRRIRRQTGTQSDWARLVGVTQTTIGNWERGFTPPKGPYRMGLRQAAETMQNNLVEAFGAPLQRQTPVDVAVTERRLRQSILRAALTDFDFNPLTSKIIPIPFSGDYPTPLPEEIEEDRRNLLESLAAFAEIIVSSIGEDSNIQSVRFSKYMNSYADEARSDLPNPRLLNRLGATLSRISNSDDFRYAASEIDSEAIDGFNRDHLELMRLYFREALAKAQEIDATDIADSIRQSTGDEFRAVADLMESAESPLGEEIIDSTIPTLLRDIAGEIRDLDEAVTFTTDPDRRRILERRKNEAFKGDYIPCKPG